MVPFVDEEACIHFKTGGCQICEQVCEKEAVNHEMEDQEIEIEVGSIIIASGFKPFDPKRIPSLGYGRFENVITGLEFEKLNNAVSDQEMKTIILTALESAACIC